MDHMPKHHSLPWNGASSGHILDSEGMGAIFYKKGKNMLKKGKTFEKLGKNWRKCNKFDNYFKKGSLLRAIIARNK